MDEINLQNPKFSGVWVMCQNSDVHTDFADYMQIMCILRLWLHMSI